MQLEAPVILAVPIDEEVRYVYTRFVRFDADPRLFSVWPGFCAELGCKCVDALLAFQAVADTGVAVEPETSFIANVNIKTGSAQPGPDCPPIFDAIIAELGRDLPAEVQADWLAERKRELELAQRLELIRDPSFIADLGLYPSIDEILGLSGWSHHPFQHGDAAWVMEDRYCPVRKCACDAAHLHFHRPKVPGTTFSFRLASDGGIDLWDPQGMSMAEALEVASSWARSWKGTDGFFTRRLDLVKSLGFDDQPRPIVRTEPKIGRNDACPCGSGKKYKKCCGR